MPLATLVLAPVTGAGAAGRIEGEDNGSGEERMGNEGEGEVLGNGLENERRGGTMEKYKSVRVTERRLEKVGEINENDKLGSNEEIERENRKLINRR